MRQIEDMKSHYIFELNSEWCNYAQEIIINKVISELEGIHEQIKMTDDASSGK